NPYTEDKDGYPVAVKEGALKYAAPFELTAEMLIKQGQVYALLIRAVAVKGDAISENGAAAGYVVYPNAPAFSPVAGAVKEGTEVTITCVPAVADIYYTTDGTTPTMENSAKYTEPIKVTEDMTIKAIAVLGQYQASASAAYTIMAEATPVELTFDPASGSEVEENTEVTITANQEVEIFYMMFESEEAAKAAEWDQEKALSYSAELKPVLTADKNTLKVAYALEGAEAVESEFFYATYTVKPLPAIELTFNPAPGSEVEEGTEVTVTASRETEIFYNVYASKEAADADEAFMANAKEVGEDGMPVITKEATYLRCAVTDKGEMVYFDAAYTIKTANEDLELVGVSVYPNPSNGVFNIELPVAATIEVFMSNGMLYQRLKFNEGAATLNIERSGIYFLRITGEGRTTIKRVIVR
ncbi:MAG: chitobiase/beta-hexosaminidase C-terminal domain-containing protein, partial [Bacteroidales bacterium]|nr:chitobiase/beta-hexosaminidase C-terminal domain-containing protein [Bacteroidales bacterium]